MDVELAPVGVDAVQVTPQIHEETDPKYIHERLQFTTWIERIGFVIIVLAIAQIVLAILHFLLHRSDLAKALIVSGVIFLFGALASLYWAHQANKAYRGSIELFQPRMDDRLTRVVFIGGLVLIGIAAVLWVNLLMQRYYPGDYVTARNTSPDIWNKKYEGRTEEGILKFLKVTIIVQACFMAVYLVYFAFAARAAFKCLKFDNRTVSYLVFLGLTLLLAFALGLVYYANHALGYSDFPQIKSHFPLWNIRGLFGVGIALALISFVGFAVDHKSYRIGFLVVGFIVLFLLLLLTNFTGFAFRHTKDIYSYYKGVPNANTCVRRMELVDLNDLDHYGCPRKYLPDATCPSNQTVTKWETVNDSDVQEDSDTEDEDTQDPKPAERKTVTIQHPDGTVTTTRPDGSTTTVTSDGTTTTTTTTPPSDTATATMSLLYGNAYEDYADYYGAFRNLQSAGGSYCLNMRCCGLLGQLYAKDFLHMANFGLATILAGVLVVFGCFYFWYVDWIDVSRDKRRDFIWLGIMLLTVIVFLTIVFNVHLTYVKERLGDNHRHLEGLEL